MNAVFQIIAMKFALNLRAQKKICPCFIKFSDKIWHKNIPIQWSWAYMSFLKILCNEKHTLRTDVNKFLSALFYVMRWAKFDIRDLRIIGPLLNIFELRENWGKNDILLFRRLKKLHFCVYRELAWYVERNEDFVLWAHFLQSCY